MSRTTANLLLLVAGLVWGGGFIAQATAMDDIGPFLFMTMRFLLAALAILPFAIWEGNKAGAKSLSRNEWLSAIAVGLLFFTAMAMQQLGLLATSVTNAGVLTGLYVVLVPIIVLGVFKEQQPKIIWPAAAAAFFGIWLLGGGGLDKLTWGDWIIIIGALFAALHVIAMGRTVTDLRRPALLASAQFAISGILAAVGFAISRAMEYSFEPPFSLATTIAAGPEILYAALFAGALAFTIMAVCQQYTSASNAAILLSSEALFAALAGAIFLDERLTPMGYLGCGILFAAIVVVSVAAAKLEDEELETRT
ncbi:MAG: DMT family transporter [Rhizobiaceae bacterium]